MNLETLKKQYKSSLSSWFLFDYCLPIFFIMGFWPIALYLLKIPFAFERVFSNADLIPVSSLLMLAASREIESEKMLGRISKEMNLTKQLGIFLPIVMLSVYSVLKVYSMTYHFPENSDREVDNVISTIPYLSFSSAILAGCFCFMTKWGIISSLRTEAVNG
jgi:hypothetical protein